MRQKSVHPKSPSERIVKNIRRATRKRHSSEEKIRIVLDGLRGESSIAQLCQHEGIVLRRAVAAVIHRRAGSALHLKPDMASLATGKPRVPDPAARSPENAANRAAAARHHPRTPYQARHE